jgi:hypothetical protein
MGSLNTHNMNTLRGSAENKFPPEFGITLIVIERLEQVEIFDLHMPRQDTFVRRKL